MPRLSPPEWIFVGLLMLAATLIAIPGINQGLWYDEIATLIFYVRRPAWEIITGFEGLNNHILYSLCAHFTTGLFGESAATLRLPALVFGIASIPALYYLCRQIANWQVAVLTCVFLTFNYQFIWFCLNARGYTAVLLGSTLATILFIRIIAEERPSVGLLLAYALVVSLSAWAHLTGVIVALGHGGVWLIISAGPLLRGEWAGPARRAMALIGSALFTLLLYAHILGQVYAALAVHNPDWAQPVEQTSESEPAVAVVTSPAPKASPQRPAGSDQPISGEVPVSPTKEVEALPDRLKWTGKEFLKGLSRALPGGTPTVVLMFLVLGGGLVAAARGGGVIFGLLVFPILIAVMIAMSAMGTFLPRFIFCAVPFIMILGVLGGFELGHRVTPFLSSRQVLAAGLVVAAVGAMRIPDTWKPKQDFVGAATYIAEHQRESTAYVCIGLTGPPMTSYYHANCHYAQSMEELVAIEKENRETVVLYTLPLHFKNNHGKLARYVRDTYSELFELPSTVNGGELTFVNKIRSSHNDSE